MINPDDYASYETWKAKKIAGQIDITISAFNAEAAALALAWEAGVDAMAAGSITRQNKDDVKRGNPYRAKGMTGAVPE